MPPAPHPRGYAGWAPASIGILAALGLALWFTGAWRPLLEDFVDSWR